MKRFSQLYVYTTINQLTYITSIRSKNSLKFLFCFSYSSIRLSGKCLSFSNVFFTTVHLHKNVKTSLWNVAVFIATKQNGSYVIRRNNIKQKTLCVYYFLIKRKKLFGQTNVCRNQLFWPTILWNRYLTLRKEIRGKSTFHPFLVESQRILLERYKTLLTNRTRFGSGLTSSSYFQDSVATPTPSPFLRLRLRTLFSFILRRNGVR